MSALAAKLVCEARELARQGAVSEARQVLRRALGSLPEGETLPEADELLEKLEPKATADDQLVADFRAFMSGEGDGTTQKTRPDPEATKEPASTAASRQRPAVDDVFIDEAEQRRQQSVRRVRIGAAVAVALVCIYPIMELIRVWSPPAAEGDTQTTSIAAIKPRVAMPQLDFGAGRKPHRYSDAEVRRLFVSSSRDRDPRVDKTGQHAPTAASTLGTIPRGAGASFSPSQTHQVPGVSRSQEAGVSRSPKADVRSGRAAATDIAPSNAEPSQRIAPQQPVLAASSGIDSTGGTVNSGKRQPHGRTSETRPSSTGRSRRPRHKSGKAKSAAPAPSRRSRGGRYFSPGRLLAVNDAPTKDKSEKLKLPIRTKIQAKLDLGITSSRHGKVLAVVQETVGSGRNTIPRGAVLVGTSDDDGKRIYVRFSEVHISGKKPYGIDAVATEDNYRGLTPQRIESSLEQRQGARVAQGAIEVAGDIARRAAGVASPIVDGVVDEAAAEQTVDRTITLAIPSGRTFVAKVIE